MKSSTIRYSALACCQTQGRRQMRGQGFGNGVHTHFLLSVHAGQQRRASAHQVANRCHLGWAGQLLHQPRSGLRVTGLGGRVVVVLLDTALFCQEHDLRKRLRPGPADRTQ
jgi:hypothetical protein